MNLKDIGGSSSVNLENTVSNDSGKSVGKVSLRCACRT